MSKLINGIVVAAALFAASGSALAEPSAARGEARTNSEKQALNGKAIATYKGLPGPGRKTMLNGMRARLLSNGAKHPSVGVDISAAAVTADDENWTVHRGEGWLFSVHGDGDKVGFINETAQKNAERARLPARAASKPPQLETKGREFIASVLSDVVVTQPNEKLVAWRTIQNLASSMSNGAKGEQWVAATLLEFRRTIDGVPVLGPGSRVTLTFAADGSIVGFDADWSKFRKSNRTVKTIDRAAVSNRVSARRQARTLPGLNMTMAGSEQPLECGYYDLGAEHSGRELVPACVSAYTQRDPGGRTSRGYRDIIPLDPDANGPIDPGEKIEHAAPPSGL